MADYGIKVTRPGYGVDDTDPTHYAFNSAYSTVKIIYQPATYQTINVPANGTASITIAHGLDFIPLVMVFAELKVGSGHWYQGGNAIPDPDDYGEIDYELDGCYVDSTNIVITFRNHTGAQKTVKYFYYLFGDNGA